MKIALVRSVRNLSLVILLSIVAFGATAQKGKRSGSAARSYIALKVYHAAEAEQLATIDQYFQNALLPQLEKAGFKNIGAFKAIDSDTAKDKRFYLLIPVSSLPQLETLTMVSDKTIQDSVLAPSYSRAAYNKSPFSRTETILLRAFEGMPQVKASGAGGNADEKVYELRSYESATEALHQNKVQMFNTGEVSLFDRLGFNAVFYGQVIAGSRMPNLMYMTSFSSKASRDEHWKSFGSDPEWKTMSAKPEYQNNVSKIDITFLRPLSYSKL